EARLKELRTLAQKTVTLPHFLLTLIPEFSRDCVDPGVLINSQPVYRHLDADWSRYLKATAEGAVSHPGGAYWLFFARDGAIVTTCCLDERLYAFHFLKELRTLFELARA